ncbi:MAG: glycosyltransferase family 2 protein [Candidatus Poribacteria bacterium]|nr:glycosyltransferase family 2 protein [Candidatus Poribacteria bacterium]
MEICLLLPAYNESKTIGEIIQESSEFISEIVVIDDGSSDETGEIAIASGAVCLSNAMNRGKGSALRKGFAYALAHGYELIFTMDSDHQHEPADIPRFLEHFHNTRPDILIGARIKHDSRVLMPLHRRVNNRLISYVGSKLCGQQVPDFQSGYRLIRADVLQQVHLETERYETESELLIKAGRLGFRIESLPIQTRYGDEVSHIKPLREMWLFTKLLLRSL